jgi:RNA 2',3'-cyclic 3'-phosphodiesterase
VEQAQGTPFDLLLDQVGHWQQAQVLWCGPSVTPAPLARLVQDLHQELAKCGILPEDRPYAAHITLLRHARPHPFQPLARPLYWPVRELALVASCPAGALPRYRVLRRWPLGADQGP